MTVKDSQASAVARQFDVAGELQSVERYGSGHIHDTYRSTWLGKDGRPFALICQRINDQIFRDVPGLMRNIVVVTEHVGKKIRAAGHDEKVLEVVRARDGAYCARDGSGGWWRCYQFISGTRSVDVCEGPAQAEEGARAFARFQEHLLDLDATGIGATIPLFHSTPNRYRLLREAIAEDGRDRLKEVSAEIDFALEREQEGGALVAAIESGDIPRRVSHGDTKLNNVLFDERDGRGVGVVDLDTCMPFSFLYDFGDLVRNVSVPTAEDERDLAKVQMDERYFEAVVAGYAHHLRAHLTARERELMTFAPRIIALTLGIRFLTDYLNGDTYFKTHRPGQNLDRARAQFGIVRSMTKQAERMHHLVQRYFS